MPARLPLLVLSAFAFTLAPHPANSSEREGANQLLAQLSSDGRQRLAHRGMAMLDARVDAGGDWIEGLVLFDAAIDGVWALLAQGDRQTEYRPELNEIRTISVDERGRVDEHHMQMMFVAISYRLRYAFDERARRMQWELDPSFENSLDQVSGFWELHDLGDGRTLGRFGTAVRVGDALPAWLQDGMTRRQVPETLDRCRRWVDSGGEWRA